MTSARSRRPLFIAAAVVTLCAIAGADVGVRAADHVQDRSVYAVETWRQPQGLPQDSVLTLLQTRDSYLWMGTKGGLARFDGVRFTAFDDRTSEQLRENEVWALAEGADASVWIGTYGGGLSRLKDGKFTVYTTADGLVDNFVTRLCVSSDGSLWIGTDVGVSHFKDGRFTNYTVTNGLAHNSVRQLYQEPSGTVWIGASQGGITRFAGGRMIAQTIDGDRPASEIGAFYRDRAGGLWVGADGLFRVSEGRSTRYTIEPGRPPAAVRFITEGADGVMLIGTVNGLVKRQGGQFTTHTFDQLGPAPEFMTFLRDREGSIWAGSQTLGLSRLRESLFTTYGGRTGLPDQAVASVFQHSSGTMWAGSSTGLAWLGDGRFQQVKGLPAVLVSSIAEDRAGHLWVGTQRGLFRSAAPAVCSPSRCAVRFTPVRHGTILDGYIRVVFADAAGTIWAGTNADGLVAYSNRRFVTYSAREGLSNGAVRAIQQGRDGALWVGTRGGGLSRLKDGRFTTYTSAAGLPNDNVQSLFMDRDNVLWIATRQGLGRMQDGRFTTYTVSDGLYSSYVYTVVEGDDGNLWMSCSKGIFRVSKRDLTAFADGRSARIASHEYGLQHGLGSTVGSVGRQPGAFKAADGSIWFAMPGSGLSVVDPRNLPRNLLPPPVRIEDVTIDRRSFGRPGVAEAAPGRGELSFQYTALTFVAPEKVRFKYKLEGYDVDWVEAGVRRAAYYNNISPGRYTFRVTAGSDEGVWNEVGDAYTLYLSPHFYQTAWFIALSFVCAAGLLAGGHRFRIRKVQKRERQLGLLVDQRTRELEGQRAFLRQVIDFNPGFIFAKERSGRFTLANRSLAAAYGTTVDDLVGRTDAELHALPEELARFRADDAAVLDSGIERFIPEVAFTDSSGVRRWLEITRIPLTGPDGKVSQILGVATDITTQKQAAIEMRRARDAAEAATEAKSAFLANMSHEIRTPMNGVLGMTELVLDTDLEPEQREYLEMARSSARNLLTVINDVLDFSKIEAGQMLFERREFALRGMIASTVGTLKLRAAQDGLLLQSEVAADVPDAVIADPHRLGQVLLNLLGNAIKFTHEGSVTLRVSLGEPLAAGAAEAALHLEVQDTGIGIPAEQQAHIFEPFKQADGSTTRKYGGTGLGLSISTRLIEGMGGRIWLESEEGRGTTFHVAIRVGIGVSAPLHRTTVTPAARPASLRILLAEDNVVNQRVAGALLRRDGHTLTIVENGQAAVDAALAAGFDAILMDVQMPLMSGIDATVAIRAQEHVTGGHVPIIAMTAHAMQGDKDRCLLAGMDGYISKPVSLDAIREALAAVSATVAS